MTQEKTVLQVRKGKEHRQKKIRVKEYSYYAQEPKETEVEIGEP